MMRRLHVTVDRIPGRGYALACPFDQRLVDTIHHTLPETARHFDYGLRVWWIVRAEDYAALRWACAEWADFVPEKRGRRGRRA